MSKPDPDPLPHNPYFPFLKKRIELSLGVVGFFVITLISFLFCFFFLDYRVVTKGFHNFSGQTQRFLWLGLEEKRGVVGGGDGGEVGRVDFLGQGGETCNLFEGKWVWDEMYPLYNESDCQFSDQGFKCSENGRRDSFYTKWRWQPKDCNLPRFDAKTMLEKLRNQRLVFVGDSIGRNQWESLLCMLSSAIPNKDSIYEINGNPITKHTGYLVLKFKDYNCTVEYYRAPFLVVQGRPPAKAPQKARMTLKLDQMDWSSGRWRDADVLVFNTGHWWNYEKTIRSGCYFQEGNEVKEEMSVEDAYRRSIKTLVDWMGREVNMSKTQVYFRTYAPVHFRGGNWKTGGSCHMETMPELSSVVVPSQTWPQLSIVNEVLSVNSNKSQVKELNLLNVTHMSQWRRDGHASIYYRGPETGPAPLHRQDCSHWCLPGVPDTWNELLYAVFMRREATHGNETTAQAPASVT